jgi:N-acetyl-anhydromuramyl-L-alanine amidase AmpD
MLPTADNQFSLDNLQQLFNQQKIIGGPDLSALLSNLGVSYPRDVLAGVASGSELSNIGAGDYPGSGAPINLSGIDATKNKALVDLLTNAGNWQQIQQYDLGAGQPASNYFQYTGPTSAQNQGPQAAALPQTIAPTWLPTPSQLYGMQPQAPGTAIAPPTGQIGYRETTLTPTTPSIMGPLDVTALPQTAQQPGQVPGQIPGQQPVSGQQPVPGQQPIPGQQPGANLENSLFGLRIPRFQEGGLITEPTLAMVGESGPEAIVPLGDKFGYDFLSNPNRGLSSATTTFAPLPETASPNTAQQRQTSSDIFRTQAPTYLQTNRSANVMQDFMRSLYTPDDSIRAPRKYADQPPVTDPNAPDNKDYGYGQTKQYLQHGEEFANSADRVVGNGTTFGLNYDGSADPMDTGKDSAFGLRTADKNLEGASLPVSVIKNSIGDYSNNPEIMDAIKRGDYKVAVTSANGSVTKVVPIVDAGPADWTGNAIDLTYRTSHDLNTNGKAKVGYRIIGPDGDTVPVRGYHPQSTANVNWDDHIGPNQEQTDTAIKEALYRNQWASTQRGVPAGYRQQLPNAPLQSTAAQQLPNAPLQPPAAQQLPNFEEPKITNQARPGSFEAYKGTDPRKIQAIILHSSDGSEKADINTLTGGDPNHLVSAHYYTTEDGRSLHFVNDNDVAFHAGKTTGKYGYLNNSNTIGIEQEHVDGTPWKDTEVRGTAQRVAELLQRYPNLTLDNVLGHSDIAPERKQDPLNFPWNDFKKYVQEDMKGTTGAAVAKTETTGTPEIAQKETTEKAPEEEEAPTQQTKAATNLGTKLAQLTAQERTMIQPGKTQAVLSTIKQKPVVRTPEEMPAFA